MAIIMDTLTKIDTAVASYIQNVFMHVGPPVAKMIKAAGVVGISFIAVNGLMQFRTIQFSEYFNWSVKYILILMFATTWANFAPIYDIVTNVPSSYGGALLNSTGFGAGGDTGIYQQMDSFVASIFEMAKVSMKRGGLFNLTPKIVGVVLAILGAFFVVAAVIIMCIGKIGLAMAFSLAPLFIASLMFKPTSELFHSWSKLTIGFAMIPLVVASIMGIVLGLSKALLGSWAADGGGFNFSDLAGFLIMILASVFLLWQVPMLVQSLSGSIVGGINGAAAAASAMGSAKGGAQRGMSAGREMSAVKAAGGSGKDQAAAALAGARMNAGWREQRINQQRLPQSLDPKFRGGEQASSNGGGSGAPSGLIVPGAPVQTSGGGSAQRIRQQQGGGSGSGDNGPAASAGTGSAPANQPTNNAAPSSANSGHAAGSGGNSERGAGGGGNSDRAEQAERNEAPAAGAAYVGWRTTPYGQSPASGSDTPNSSGAGQGTSPGQRFNGRFDDKPVATSNVPQNTSGNSAGASPSVAAQAGTPSGPRGSNAAGSPTPSGTMGTNGSGQGSSGESQGLPRAALMAGSAATGAALASAPATAQPSRTERNHKAKNNGGVANAPLPREGGATSTWRGPAKTPDQAPVNRHAATPSNGAVASHNVVPVVSPRSASTRPMAAAPVRTAAQGSTLVQNGGQSTGRQTSAAARPSLVNSVQRSSAGAPPSSQSSSMQQSSPAGVKRTQTSVAAARPSLVNSVQRSSPGAPPPSQASSVQRQSPSGAARTQSANTARSSAQRPSTTGSTRVAPPNRSPFKVWSKNR
jgi:type IV secretion system protein VirB6